MRVAQAEAETKAVGQKFKMLPCLVEEGPVQILRRDLERAAQRGCRTGGLLPGHEAGCAMQRVARVFGVARDEMALPREAEGGGADAVGEGNERETGKIPSINGRVRRVPQNRRVAMSEIGNAGAEAGLHAQGERAGAEMNEILHRLKLGKLACD